MPNRTQRSRNSIGRYFVSRRCANRRFAAVAALGLLLTGGCLRIEQHLVLQPDSTGTISLTYGMTEKNLMELEILRTLGSNETEMGRPTRQRDPFRTTFPFSEAALRDRLADCAEHGVTIEKIQTETHGIWRYMLLNLRFENLADLRKTQFFQPYTFALGRDDDDTWRLTFNAVAGPVELPADTEELSAVAAARALTSGFRVDLRTTVPGKILSANATQIKERTAIWHFDSDEDPNAIQQASRFVFGLTFDGTDARLVPCGEPQSFTPNPSLQDEEPAPAGKE